MLSAAAVRPAPTAATAEATLHYFYDPLCGWCYAASPLLAAVATLPGLRLELHGGGLMSGSGSCRVSPALRRYVIEHDRRIAELTGQPFGTGYFEGLLYDETAILDSTPPIAAIRAVERCGGEPLAMLAAIQRAHYVEGRRVAEAATLKALALALGLDEAAWNAAWAGEQGRASEHHIEDSRAKMRAWNLQGFPACVLESADGLQALPTANYLGRPDDWRRDLAARLAAE